MTSELPYDRAARRVADNAHGNTPTGDYRDGDDVAAAVYPDPKARHLKTVDGDNAIIAEKRALATPQVIEDQPITRLTATKVTKAKA